MISKRKGLWTGSRTGVQRKPLGRGIGGKPIPRCLTRRLTWTVKPSHLSATAMNWERLVGILTLIMKIVDSVFISRRQS